MVLWCNLLHLLHPADPLPILRLLLVVDSLAVAVHTGGVLVLVHPLPLPGYRVVFMQKCMLVIHNHNKVPA